MAFNKGDVVICIDDSYSFCELILNYYRILIMYNYNYFFIHLYILI